MPHYRCWAGNIPPAQLLAGIGQFNPTEQDDSPKLVAQLMSKLKGNIGGPNSTPSMVATGERLPLLPKICVEKILAGEFIDFAELPPAKGKVESIPQAVKG